MGGITPVLTTGKAVAAVKESGKFQPEVIRALKNLGWYKVEARPEALEDQPVLPV
jgi:hypothetical protein